MREDTEREIRKVQKKTEGVRFKGLVLCEGLGSEIRRVHKETNGLRVNGSSGTRESLGRKACRMQEETKETEIL